jgi:uncharacterized damage-inducible protein DinB
MPMKTAGFVAMLLFAVGMLVVSAQAQEGAKKAAAAKPAPSTSQAVLQNWNEIGRKLIAMAEDFPANKYDYKPTPSVGSFAQRMIHAAAANYFFTNLATGKKAPAEEDPKRDQFKSKADIVSYVKKSFTDGAAAIKSKGDRGMSALIVDPFSNQQTRVNDFAYGLIEHSGEVYGQLTLYYRMAGMVPPESRPKK